VSDDNVRETAAKIFVAGVDDTWSRRHDMKKALADRLFTFGDHL
jgi:hypothetical protein